MVTLADFLFIGLFICIYTLINVCMPVGRKQHQNYKALQAADFQDNSSFPT